MVARPKVEALPDEVRKWLDNALLQNNFSGYEALEKALEERGHSIGKSSIGRYGQKLQRRLSAIKASTEAAKLITEGAEDSKDARSEAVIALVQSEIFDTLINLQEAEEADGNGNQIERFKLLNAAAKNIATLTRASVSLKRYKVDLEAEVRQRILDEQRMKLDELSAGAGDSARTMTPEEAYMAALANVRKAYGLVEQ